MSSTSRALSIHKLSLVQWSLLSSKEYATTTPRHNAQEIKSGENEVAKVHKCLTCKVSFEDSLIHRAHYKSNWHCNNIKRKVELLDPLTEEQFNNPERINVHERPIEQVQKPKEFQEVLHEGQVYIVYKNQEGRHVWIRRSIFQQEKQPPLTDEKLHEWLQVAMHASRKVKNSPFLASLNFEPWKWFIILSGGGYFSGALFENGVCTLHKTFRRYTVRRKAGGAQSSYDKKGGFAHSAGAQIRRNNEVLLRKDIESWLQSNASKISGCQLIFIRSCASTSDAVSKGLASHTPKGDPRLRTIPITTYRPSFEEAKRVYESISTIFISESDQLGTVMTDERKRRKKHRSSTKPKRPIRLRSCAGRQ